MPVKTVYIAAISPRGVDSPVDDGGVVTLTQLRDDGVACVAVVDGSRHAPQVEVIVGDVDGTRTAATGKCASGISVVEWLGRCTRNSMHCECDSRPPRCRVITLGKLFTPVCLYRSQWSSGSMHGCGVKGHGQLFITTTTATGYTSLLQFLRRLSLPLSVGRQNNYQLLG